MNVKPFTLAALLGMTLFSPAAFAGPPPKAVTSSAPPTREAILAEAKTWTERLTDPTEKCIALLTLGQAQTKMGDNAAARRTLAQGWEMYPKMPEFPPPNVHVGELLDGDDSLANLPPLFIRAFVAAGDEDSARRIVDAGAIYRQGLYGMLLPEFPEFARSIRWSEQEKRARIKLKDDLLSQRDAARAEFDGINRASRLTGLASQLLYLGYTEDALPLLRESVPAAAEVKDAEQRAYFQAGIASGLWEAGALEEAKTINQEADKAARSVTDIDKRLQARLGVETVKKKMKLPNEAAAVEQAIRVRLNQYTPDLGMSSSRNRGANGVVEMPLRALINAASKRLDAGDNVGACALLHRIKIIPQQNIDSERYDWGEWFRAAKLMIQAGDSAGARQLLSAANRRIIAGLQPVTDSPTGMATLEELTRFQIEAGDKPGAQKSARDGIAALTKNPASLQVTYKAADAKGREYLVHEDLLAPVLHRGAQLQERAGDWVGAAQTARRISYPAHRAIALAALVRGWTKIALD